MELSSESRADAWACLRQAHAFSLDSTGKFGNVSALVSKDHPC